MLKDIIVSYETVRNWCGKFGQWYCSQIRKNRGHLGYTWYLDVVFIKINGVLHYLWRTVGEDGDEIDILAQKRKDKHAAKRCFNKLLKGQQCAPI
jgi:putative transposase